MMKNSRDMMMFAGVSALNNAELLSLMAGINADQARGVLDYAEETAGGLGRMEVRELMEADGIGESKAAAIAAGLELFKRLSADEMGKVHERINNSQQAAEMVMQMTQYEDREHFIVFCLDTRLCIKSRHVVSIGNLDAAPVHPREVFHQAIKRSAAAVIVAHNHPSGDPAPSPQDIEATKRLCEAGEILGIKVLDHVIVGNGCFTSMKSEGYMEA